jgi:hypothetical protein
MWLPRHDAHVAFVAIVFMAADSRRAGRRFVKDAGFAGVAEGGRFAILDKARPPGTLAAKKAMAQYQ